MVKVNELKASKNEGAEVHEGQQKTQIRAQKLQKEAEKPDLPVPNAKAGEAVMSNSGEPGA